MPYPVTLDTHISFKAREAVFPLSRETKRREVRM